MKTKLLMLFMICLVSSISYVHADENTGIKSFQQDKDSWRRKNQDKAEILPQIADSMGQAAAKNITDAEEVFCYFVEAVTPDYNGYTLDGMAVKSYCGNMAPEVKNVVTTVLLGTEENISSTRENCIIRPRMILRFVRGVDYTDVLLSSPCYSFTIFYAGKVKSYNFTPGSEIIDTLLKDFNTKPIPFVSPALLGQVLPVGIPQTQSDKEKVNIQNRENAPVKGWEKEQPKKNNSGWNNLNM
ncbi:MAG: hypothetical protein ACK5N8_05150 [Alphaproteobacteria bacterium]